MRGGKRERKGIWAGSPAHRWSKSRGKRAAMFPSSASASPHVGLCFHITFRYNHQDYRPNIFIY